MREKINYNQINKINQINPKYLDGMIYESIKYCHNCQKIRVWDTCLYCLGRILVCLKSMKKGLLVIKNPTTKEHEDFTN